MKSFSSNVAPPSSPLMIRSRSRYSRCSVALVFQELDVDGVDMWVAEDSTAVRGSGRGSGSGSGSLGLALGPCARNGVVAIGHGCDSEGVGGT